MSLPERTESSGGMINPARISRWSLVALGIQLAMLFAIVLGTHGFIVPLSHPTTTDFASFYAAGRLADGPAPALAYNRAAHEAAEQIATSPGINYVFFFYPPTFLLICGLLPRLPYIMAFVLFETLTAAALLQTLRWVTGRGGWRQLLPAASFSPLIWNVGIGQNACLTAALFGCATVLLQARRPLGAGLAFACLCYKPHFGLLIPLALAAAGEWSAIAAAGLVLVSLVGISALLFGPETWLAFLHAMSHAQGDFAAGHVVPWRPMISVYGAARMLGAGPAAAYVAEALVSVVVAGCTVWSWRRPDDGSGIRNAVLVSGTLLIAPVGLFYDLVLLLVAVAWIVRSATRTPLGSRERLVLASVWLAGLVCYPAAGAAHVPVGTICTCCIFIMSLARQHHMGDRSSNLNSHSLFWICKDVVVLLARRRPPLRR